MDKITKDTMIPNELAVKIIDEITVLAEKHGLSREVIKNGTLRALIKLAEKHGLSREVIKNGTLRALIKWEKEHADKSGG